MGKRLRLTWQEQPCHIVPLTTNSKGEPIDLMQAMDRAVNMVGLFQRSRVIPESIKFTIEED